MPTLWKLNPCTCIGFAGCCSILDLVDVNNAFVSCQTNYFCEVQCHRGNIFPDGKTEANFSCQDDMSGLMSSCKRTPVVIIEYMAAWIFNNVVPKHCDNISTLLNHSETMLNDIRGVCNTLAVDVNMTFQYRTLAFLIYPSFKGTYYNFISTEVLQTCLSVQLDYLDNQTLHFFDLIFNNITCENRSINHTLGTDWHISDRQEHCPAGSEVKNVTVKRSNGDGIEYYCETIKLNTDSSWTADFQYSTNVTTTLAVNDKTPANYTAIYIAAPILGIASLIVIMSTFLCYKMRSRQNKRQNIYQTISSINDGQTNELTNDSHNYDIMAFRENSSEISRY